MGVEDIIFLGVGWRPLIYWITTIFIEFIPMIWSSKETIGRLIEINKDIRNQITLKFMIRGKLLLAFYCWFNAFSIIIYLQSNNRYGLQNCIPCDCIVACVYKPYNKWCDSTNIETSTVGFDISSCRHYVSARESTESTMDTSLWVRFTSKYHHF